MKNNSLLPLRRGLMLVLSSPSGAGKTSISRQLLKLNPDLQLSVSVTTRPPRPGEIEGKDYYFIQEDQFHALCEKNQLLEYAKVFDYYYGTPRGPVEKALAQGQDVLFDIDWQGTQSLAQSARGDLVTLFILPPHWLELERRLKTRAQDSNEVVAKRMAKATDEISHWAEYEYVLINQDLEKTVNQVQSILFSERLKRKRQISLTEFVKSLRFKH